MPDEVLPAVTDGGAPLDFAEYEAWHNAGRKTPEASTPAAVPAKAVTAKTDPAPEPEDDQQEDDEQEETEPVEKPQKKSGFQRRIDRLNQKLGAKDAEIEALKRSQGGNATEKKEAPKPAEAAEGKPEAKNFDSYEAYVEALADWKLDNREKAQAQAKADREAAEAHAAAVAAADKSFSERKKLYPDWAEKVEAATDIAITQIMHSVIVESEYRADLGYYLAEHPEEAERIAKLSPARQAAELGKLETSFEKSTAETPKPRVSKAPAPPKQVRAQAEAGEPDPSDFGAWERWRNAQPGANLRR